VCLIAYGAYLAVQFSSPLRQWLGLA
jgi:hypothetical protein